MQLRQAQHAGARFAVSPGCTPALASTMRAGHFPFLPGVQTVSEAMALAGQGFRLLKFFPAEQAGGIGWLKAIGAPLADLRFCPTGGVTAETAPAYLALPNVACVGGSWVAPKKAIEAGDWAAIAELSTVAAGLKRGR
jgi:2-dehydro-3-deoxyphosphogluconate aldolase/(4S)-4-hydroxy-2-oxoglutarate aldolase